MNKSRFPTLKDLRKKLREETKRSYTLDNMSRAYDDSLRRIALLDAMIKLRLNRKIKL